MTLPVLLYSRYCDYSKSLLGNIKDPSQVRGVLQLTCVDGMLDRLPKHIDRVPALVMDTIEGQRVAFGAELRARLCDIMRGERRETPTAFESVSDHEFCGLIGEEHSIGTGLYASADEDVHIFTTEDEESVAKGGAEFSQDKLTAEMDRVMSQRASDITRVYGERPAPDSVRFEDGQQAC